MCWVGCAWLRSSARSVTQASEGSHAAVCIPRYIRCRSERSSKGPMRTALLVLPLLVLLLTGCQSQTPSPTPTVQVSLASPAAKPAASPSPSPGSPPSPSAVPSPSPSPAAAGSFQLDDYPFAVMIDNIA